MINLENILINFPIFSHLDDDGIKELCKIALLKDYKKGGIIYREKDAPDNLYIIISGRVKTYTVSSLRRNNILEYIYKGTSFGIISLITNEPHSVTAEAANDSAIMEIPKDKFNAFLKTHPLLALEFSRLLSRRVKKRSGKGKNIFESTTITVCGHKEYIGKTTYSLSLGYALAKESKKKVIVVEFRGNEKNFYLKNKAKVLELQKFKEKTLNSFKQKTQNINYIKMIYSKGYLGYSKIISALLSFLTQNYHFIILDAPKEKSAIAHFCITQADFVHFILEDKQNYSSYAKNTVDFLTRKYDIQGDEVKIILTGNSRNISQSKYLHLRNHKIFATLPYIKAIGA